MAEFKSPRWSDEDAWFKIVEGELSEPEREFMLLDWSSCPGVPVGEILHNIQRDALAKARRGTMGPLADLLRPEHPMNKYPFTPGVPVSSTLTPEALTLLADRAAGKHKGRGRRGRPKMTIDERRAKYPAHYAVQELPVIEAILRTHCSEASDGDIRDRSLLFAARLFETEPETVFNLKNRGKSNRRRTR